MHLNAFSQSQSRIQSQSHQQQSHQQQCSQCQHWILPSDRFCEACGSPLALVPCPNCGASAEYSDDEGYCTQCGFRQAKSENQRQLVLSNQIAGGSDRGLQHHSNQDAFGLAALAGSAAAPASVLVVCDGVSSSPRAELASQTAVTIVVNSIMAAAAGDSPSVPSAPSPQHWLARSIMQAQQEVTALTSPNTESPSTTVVAAIVESGVAPPPRHSPTGHRITLAWLGDSRAYWLSPQGSCLLSQDHTTPQGALTRWLGNDSDLNQNPPQFQTFYPPGSGYLLLCSDGLWNYAPQPEQLQTLVQSLIPRLTAKTPHTTVSTTALVQALIQFARQQGGHDNITVALQQIPQVTSKA